MRVRVQTENGYLEIELDKFLTQPKSKVRKLFRLMEKGMTPEEKRRVLEYLTARKTLERTAICRKVVSELEQKLLKLLEEERELKQAISRARAEQQEEEMIQRTLPAWEEQFKRMVEE